MGEYWDFHKQLCSQLWFWSLIKWFIQAAVETECLLSVLEIRMWYNILCQGIDLGQERKSITTFILLLKDSIIIIPSLNKKTKDEFINKPAI